MDFVDTAQCRKIIRIENAGREDLSDQEALKLLSLQLLHLDRDDWHIFIRYIQSVFSGEFCKNFQVCFV